MAQFGKPRKSISLQPKQKSSKKSKGTGMQPWSKPGQSLPELTGRETAEDLIERFNMVYAQELRDQKKLESNPDSISTFFETPSELMKGRRCRLMVIRRGLVTSCLALWVMAIVNLRHWYHTFYVYPLHLSQDLVYQDAARNRPPRPSKKAILLTGLLTLTFGMGAFGLLCTYCARNRLLKMYMMIAPWGMALNAAYATQLIILYVKITIPNLRLPMEQRLGRYTGNFSADYNTRVWDTLQFQLKCCGIDNKFDWINANALEGEAKVPTTCCHTLKDPNKHELDDKELNKCIHLFPETMTWNKGCLIEIYTVVSSWAVTTILLAFVNIILTGTSVFFAHRYYVIQRKVVRITYKFTVKEYFINFFCLCSCCQKYLRKKHPHEYEEDPPQDIEANNPNSMEKGIVESEDEAILMYKNPMDKTKSEIIVHEPMI